uniref:Uncharacterized protein n=1 Tax=Anopheles atroparvus TaxID=41427 RepID=A0A182JGS1_ANOAO
MVYSSRDSDCSNNYPITTSFLASASLATTTTTTTTTAADPDMTSRTLTMVDETIVHDWQISPPITGGGGDGGGGGGGGLYGHVHGLPLSALHQPPTPPRPVSTGSGSWSTASGIESATDEFTVNQHYHQQEKQIEEVEGTPLETFAATIDNHRVGQRKASGEKKKREKRRRISFFKYILSFTIFRRWKTVHKAEECPSPGGFAMVLQDASGGANNSCTTVPPDGGTTLPDHNHLDRHVDNRTTDTGQPTLAESGTAVDGNGNKAGGFILASPSSSTGSACSSIVRTTDCNRNRIVVVDDSNHRHDSAQSVNHLAAKQSSKRTGGKRQHPSKAASSGKGFGASFFASVRSPPPQQQQQNNNNEPTGCVRRTKAASSGCRMSLWAAREPAHFRTTQDSFLVSFFRDDS